MKYGNTVATAAASTNSINLNYIVGIGGTTSATNQTEAAAVVATRGIVLDVIPFKSTAAIGDYVPGGYMDFSNGPLVCPRAPMLQFIVRPYGTVANNTLVVNSTVAFTGYYGKKSKGCDMDIYLIAKVIRPLERLLALSLRSGSTPQTY